jgi:hypothetical protein
VCHAYLPEALQFAEIMRTDVTRRCSAAMSLAPEAVVPLRDAVLPAVAVPAVLPAVAVPEVLPPDVVPPDVVPEVEPDMLAFVPVTSIRWPTCFLSSVSWPSSMYDVPAAPDAVEPAVVPPAVVPPAVVPPAVEPAAVDPDVLVPLVVVALPIVALVSMNAPRDVLAVEAVEVDPAVPVEPAVPPLLSCRQPVTVMVFPLAVAVCGVPLCAATLTTQPAAIAIAVAVHV